MRLSIRPTLFLPRLGTNAATMSTGFLRFLGVLLILGSVGFVTVKSAFTGGFRFVTPGYGQSTNVTAPDRR